MIRHIQHIQHYSAYFEWRITTLSRTITVRQRQYQCRWHGQSSEFGFLAVKRIPVYLYKS